MTHTPGPWVAVNVGEKENVIMVGRLLDGEDKPISQADAQYRFDTDYDAQLVCELVCEVEYAPEEGDAWANARLIAAAPELLAACKLLVGAMTVPNKAVEAIIAKAEAGG